MSDADPAAAGAEPGDGRPGSHIGTTGFAHASEAEMARILDFYAVRWEYEPDTFPILWNLDGDVVESFAPDFYLPDLDLYLELTTLKQRLVRKKNRKLRRLRELYPDLRIKLFYGRDFRQLMLKYGKLALVDTLSGTSGQVVPVRPAIEAPGAPAASAATAAHAADETDATSASIVSLSHAAAKRRRRRAAARDAGHEPVATREAAG